MKATTHGIHHVTAISGASRVNVDFYAGLLGLRLVKKTVNFDDPYTYHLYYGTETGAPGTIITFFPWSARGLRGRKGRGQLTYTAFSVPADSLNFWAERLKNQKTAFDGPLDRDGEPVIRFYDVDGIGLELVGAKADERSPWENGTVPAGKAIRGFHTVTLEVDQPEQTAALLTELLGYTIIKETDKRIRFASGAGVPGTFIDLLKNPASPPGTMGVGAVHHVAWRTESNAMQLELREALLSKGFHVSPVMDRNYFHSIYFREPGGILFEVATDPPGFTIDERPAELGSGLKLPPWMEDKRGDIENRLESLVLPY